MLALSFTTAVASFFANAAAGINAALLLNRSAKTQPRESAAGGRQASKRPVKVQLWVAKGVPSRSSDVASTMPRGAAQLRGPGSFDKDLLARQIKTHREAIALYEGKASGPDPQLRIFARDILPHLQQHLAMLESLQSENRHARR
jgi:predicted outer membrane protein